MGLFGEYLDQIGQAITINDDDRKVYTYDFDRIRDYILRSMCRKDHAFEVLCKGPSLFGSYGNNVRIHNPDEFDVHIMLKPPFAQCMYVESDEDRPGFVNLNFLEVLKQLRKTPCSSDVYDLLYDLTDKDGYLVRGRVQRWLEELFEDVLSDCDYSFRGYWGDLYTVTYSKRGLAHTIFAECEARKISIDLVPAFVFFEEDWMQLPQKHVFQEKCDYWLAVPKPSPGDKRTRRIAFMICNPVAEHELLLKKYNLKVVFRLLKSLRKRYGLNRLKSYFITTAFLWEIEEHESSFWQNSIEYLFVYMLDKLTSYFEDENLPFFWNEDLNLLDILYPDEIRFYTNSLVSAYNKLNSYVHQPNIGYYTVKNHFDI